MVETPSYEIKALEPGGAPPSDLLGAINPDDILRHSARYLWSLDHRGGTCPSEEIPTTLDIAKLLSSCAGGNAEITEMELLLDWIGPAHASWIRDGAAGTHPLDLVLRCWWNRPQRTEDLTPETLDKRIIPKGLFPEAQSYVDVRGRQDTDGPLPIPGPTNRQAQLPLFPFASGAPLPMMPLLMVDATDFRGLGVGQGARLDKRLFYYVVLQAQRKQRSLGSLYHWKTPLRTIVNLCWDEDYYREGRHGPKLRAAFDAVTLTEVPLPNGGTWLPVVVLGRPDYGNLDSPVVFQITFPSNSDRGPMIDFPALIEYGRHSDTAFDAWLRLPYLFDEAKRSNGGKRVYAGSPGEEHMPWLNPDQRRQLVYGLKEQSDKSNRSRERKRADKVLEQFAKDGRIQIKRDGPLWLILEKPPKTDEPAPYVAQLDPKVFDAIWNAYPQRPENSEMETTKEMSQRVKEGYDVNELLEGAKRYVAYCEARNILGTQYVMTAQRFFSQDCYFRKDWTHKPTTCPHRNTIEEGDYFRCLQCDAIVEK